MPAIGNVTKHQDGNFKGHLKTLSFRAPIDILLNPSKSGDTQPDYRVYSQAVEIGAGWIKKGKNVRRGLHLTEPRRPRLRPQEALRQSRPRGWPG